MDDINKSIIGIIAVIGLIVGFVIFAEIVETKQAENYAEKLRQEGKDVPDIKVFLKGSGFKMKEFYESPSLRKQYENFREGNGSEFMEQAKINKKLTDTQSAANSAAAMSAMSAGMAAGRR